MRHRFEYLLFLTVRFLILILPLKSAQRLGVMLGDVGFHLMRARVAITLDNLRRAFPDKADGELQAIARGAFRNYGISIAEFLWFPNFSEEDLRRTIRVGDVSLFLEAYRKGRGLVMLSGHFGNWELIAFGVAALTGIPFTIIVQTQSNKLIDAVINRHRCLRGTRVIPRDKSIREILKSLQEGKAVAIAPDQSGSIESVYVNFFGRRVATHQGPAAFALRSGAPVFMGFMIRAADGTYDVIIEEVPSADLSGYSETNVCELTQRHTALLERYIRMYPTHWLWMHRRWKHTQMEQVSQPKPSSPAAL